MLIFENSWFPAIILNLVLGKRNFITASDYIRNLLLQGFTTKKIPENLNAIVIGSGIGGLTCAALLAKSGKKVLVLEQHDQAGGCCHTFIEKGNII